MTDMFREEAKETTETFSLSHHLGYVSSNVHAGYNYFVIGDAL